MRICMWCTAPLLGTEYKGHRQKEYCSDACKMREYRFRKRHGFGLKQAVLENSRLKRELKRNEQKLKEQNKYLQLLEDTLQYARANYENMYLDCIARLRAAGMSERDVTEFMDYWRETRNDSVQDFVEDRLKEKIQERWADAAHLITKALS